MKFRVGRKTMIPPGTKIAVKTPIETVLVAHVHGDFFAVSNICPHAGGYLHEGPLTEYLIECPLHYWGFDLRSGHLQGFDGVELDYGERLNVYPVIIEGDILYLELPEPDGV